MFVIPVDLPPKVENTVQVAEHQTIQLNPITKKGGLKAVSGNREKSYLSMQEELLNLERSEAIQIEDRDLLLRLLGDQEFMSGLDEDQIVLALEEKGAVKVLDKNNIKLSSGINSFYHEPNYGITQWRVEFDFDKDVTKDTLPNLDTRVCYQATGYASMEGTKKYNLKLSARRAQNVSVDLRKSGIQVEAKGLGANEEIGRAVIIKEVKCEN